MLALRLWTVWRMGFNQSNTHCLIADIGKSENTPGISYVALSRVKSLSSCVIEPMTLERLTGLKSSFSLKYRLDEENRLDKLAEATCQTYYLSLSLILLYRYNAYTEVKAPEALDKCKGKKVFVFLMQ